MAETNVHEVLKAISDVSFPAGKDDLEQVAQRSGASPGVMAALAGIPPEEYANKDEVARSVRTPADTDIPHSAAQKAQQARKGGKPGLSQHLRDAEKPPVERELEE
ncbi:DUF2795 domain-containing protein [Streptomyces iconiensis]|uniref:DUF2795 domain-containing protein n=1 Tax=Streptomyces iconiensis TaxID=1384038 RepID=A0ABT6ZVW9_9ACTN|nr:DUF2795 domain-containing protein [Streptomyces iconiensis]MDJ1132972.1 DUF2795 domain-containing protein [Streptomyces iconiensis]